MVDPIQVCRKAEEAIFSVAGSHVTVLTANARRGEKVCRCCFRVCTISTESMTLVWRVILYVGILLQEPGQIIRYQFLEKSNMERMFCNEFSATETPHPSGTHTSSKWHQCDGHAQSPCIFSWPPVSKKKESWTLTDRCVPTCVLSVDWAA